MKKLILKGLLLFALLVAALLPLAPASANTLVTGNGRISGHLLKGTKNKTPVANQSVTLQMAQDQSAQDVSTTTTDAQGAFSFSNLSTDKTINYAIYTQYLGAQYVSDLVSLTDNPVQQVDLTVYDTTSSSANIAITRATVLLHDPVTSQGTITVSEAFFFQNLDNRSYVGALDASKGMPNALRFALPQGARAVTLGTGFNGYQSIQVDKGFATNAAVPPGESQFAFSFEIPYNSANYTFDYEAVYPTVQLSVMLPPDLHATTHTLTAQGGVNLDQRNYTLYTANQLLATHSVAFQLTNLPAPTKSGPPTIFDVGNLWLIGGIVLMLLILGATWLYYRSLRRSAVPAKKRRGATLTTKHGKAVPASTKARKAVEVAEKTEQEQRQLLLQQLLELDKSFEAGKITKTVYRERRAKLKTRLRSLMDEEEAART